MDCIGRALSRGDKQGKSELNQLLQLQELFSCLSIEQLSRLEEEAALKLSCPGAKPCSGKLFDFQACTSLMQPQKGHSSRTNVFIQKLANSEDDCKADAIRVPGYRFSESYSNDVKLQIGGHI